MALASLTPNNMAMSAGVFSTISNSMPRMEPINADINATTQLSNPQVARDGCCKYCSLKEGLYRGELCGESCLTIDLSDESMHGAVWLEKRALCLQLKSTIFASIAIESQESASLLDFLDSKKRDRTDLPKGVIIGIENNTSDDVDYIRPFHYLENHTTDDSNENLVQTIPLPKAGLSDVTIHELCGLIILHWAKLTSDYLYEINNKEISTSNNKNKSKESDASSKQQQKAKKSKLLIQNVIFVIPSNYTHHQREALKDIAEEAGLVNIGCVSKGVATLTGLLSRPLFCNGEEEEVSINGNNKSSSNNDNSNNTNNNNNKKKTKKESSTSSSSISSNTTTSKNLIQRLANIQSTSSSSTLSSSPNVLVVLKSSSSTYIDISIIQCLKVTSNKSRRITASESEFCTPCEDGTKSEPEEEEEEGEAGIAFDVLKVLAARSTSANTASTISMSGDTNLGLLLQKVLEASAIQKSEIHAVVVDGHSDEEFRKALLVWLGKEAPPPIFQCAAGDAAVGGSLLSAAQLESSRQYVRQDDDQWTMHYILPFAIESTSAAYGLKSTENDTNIAVGSKIAEAEILLPIDTKYMYWMGLGAALPPTWLSALTKESPTPVTRRYLLAGSKGTVGTADGGDAVPTSVVSTTAAKTFTAVLCQEESNPTASTTSSWRAIAVQKPMLVQDSIGAASSCTERTITYDLDTATGLLRPRLSGDVTALSDLSRKYWNWVKTVAMTIIVSIIVLCACYGVHYQSQEARRLRETWIRDFYQKHAPEKLQDPNFVTHLSVKYKDNMPKLWKTLEKTYKVKWKPPTEL